MNASIVLMLQYTSNNQLYTDNLKMAMFQTSNLWWTTRKTDAVATYEYMDRAVVQYMDRGMIGELVFHSEVYISNLPSFCGVGKLIVGKIIRRKIGQTKTKKEKVEENYWEKRQKNEKKK